MLDSVTHTPHQPAGNQLNRSISVQPSLYALFALGNQSKTDSFQGQREIACDSSISVKHFANLKSRQRMEKEIAENAARKCCAPTGVDEWNYNQQTARKQKLKVNISAYMASYRDEGGREVVGS